MITILLFEVSGIIFLLVGRLFTAGCWSKMKYESSIWLKFRRMKLQNHSFLKWQNRQYSFLSDSSPIIVYPCYELTNWLLFSRLDWCDSGLWRCQLKTCGVVSIADVDAEECVNNSLVKILKLRFGKDFEPILWSQYWSWSQYFEPPKDKTILVLLYL